MIPIYTEKQLLGIKKSAKILKNCFSHIEGYMAEGTPLKELDAMIFDYIKGQNAHPAFLGYQKFPASACLSVNEVIIHGVPSERKLKSGDIIGVDIGVVYNGWISDMAVTFAVGAIDEASKRLLRITQEALHRGIALAKHGNRVGDISSAIQKHAESNGYSVVRDFVGHGVGEKLHQDPSVPNFGRAGDGPLLKKGMVIAIEPMINMGTHRIKILKDGWTAVTKDRKRSAHFEHTVVVGELGGVILTI